MFPKMNLPVKMVTGKNSFKKRFFSVRNGNPQKAMKTSAELKFTTDFWLLSGWFLAARC